MVRYFAVWLFFSKIYVNPSRLVCTLLIVLLTTIHTGLEFNNFTIVDNDFLPTQQIVISEIGDHSLCCPTDCIFGCCHVVTPIAFSNDLAPERFLFSWKVTALSQFTSPPNPPPKV